MSSLPESYIWSMTDFRIKDNPLLFAMIGLGRGTLSGFVQCDLKGHMWLLENISVLHKYRQTCHFPFLLSRITVGEHECLQLLVIMKGDFYHIIRGEPESYMIRLNCWTNSKTTCRWNHYKLWSCTKISFMSYLIKCFFITYSPKHVEWFTLCVPKFTLSFSSPILVQVTLHYLLLNIFKIFFYFIHILSPNVKWYQ